MRDVVEIPISRVQAREILLKVPVPFKELVAVTGAVAASSDVYRCPFCEEEVSVRDAEISLHRTVCKKKV